MSRCDLTLLLIEDDEIDVLAVRRALKRVQFTGRLVVADNVEAGASRLTDPAAPVDLILLDLNLPGRSGHEFLQSVASEPATPPVVVLTSSPDPRDRAQCLGARAAGYFVKSLDSGGLERTLRQVLGYWGASRLPGGCSR